MLQVNEFRSGSNRTLVFNAPPPLKLEHTVITLEQDQDDNFKVQFTYLGRFLLGASFSTVCGGVFTSSSSSGPDVGRTGGRGRSCNVLIRVGALDGGGVSNFTLKRIKGYPID